MFEFLRHYREQEARVPVVAIPSSYAIATETQLGDAGVNLVIYANHLLRSAYPAMIKTAQSILQHERAHEADEHCMPIAGVLDLIPSGK